MPHLLNVLVPKRKFSAHCRCMSGQNGTSRKWANENQNTGSWIFMCRIAELSDRILTTVLHDSCFSWRWWQRYRSQCFCVTQREMFPAPPSEQGLFHFQPYTRYIRVVAQNKRAHASNTWLGHFWFHSCTLHLLRCLGTHRMRCVATSAACLQQTANVINGFIRTYCSRHITPTQGSQLSYTHATGQISPLWTDLCRSSQTMRWTEIRKLLTKQIVIINTIKSVNNIFKNASGLISLLALTKLKPPT